MMGIIVVGLIYERSIDLSTENFSDELEPVISSIDQCVNTYIMGDLNVGSHDIKKNVPNHYSTYQSNSQW